ncbi:MAG TPA: metallophosphoesterase [Candidatus Limnocylindrales bacterium]|nr:metallophosphoesterase [Candidatus Limnocylindrales bacterium]
MHNDPPPTRPATRSLVLALAIAAGLAACIAPRANPGDTAAPTTHAGVVTPAASAAAKPSASPRPGATAAASATAPSPAPPVVLVGAGDIASCGSSGDEATADLLDGIAGTVFTAGDNAYDSGTAAEFADCYAPTWGRHRARTLPVPGNHDYVTAGGAGYFGYFGPAAGNPSVGWYATDLGAWRIYALNSDCWAIGGCEAGSAQERWLRDDLEASPRACVLAIWHHPRFSSGDHGSDPMTSALWGALDDAGAEIVVNGHDHDYERFAPQDVNGAADPAGIVEYVAGTGGRSHYAFGPPLANSLVRDNTAFGVLRFDLDAGGWASTFVPVAGATFTDSATGTCH